MDVVFAQRVRTDAKALLDIVEDRTERYPLGSFVSLLDLKLHLGTPTAGAA